MNFEFLSASELIAPCGINCGVCLGFLREKNRCLGCRSNSTQKPKHCFICSIKNCEYLKKTDSGFCFDCTIYPCKRIKQLDKRYRTRYHMSIIENMQEIKNYSLDYFVQTERLKWLCTNCGGTICVHRGCCLSCNNRITI